MDCLFCKIIQGELPASKVYEDEYVVAFLDIYPTRPGHTLVVPKTHCDNMVSCDPEVFAHLMKAAQKVAPAVVTATEAEGFNIGINNGKAAGQVIFHLHLHVIPRKSDDGLKLWGAMEYGEGEKEAMAEKIRSEVTPDN